MNLGNELSKGLERLTEKIKKDSSSFDMDKLVENIFELVDGLPKFGVKLATLLQSKDDFFSEWKLELYEVVKAKPSMKGAAILKKFADFDKKDASAEVEVMLELAKLIVCASTIGKMVMSEEDVRHS